MKNSLKLFTLAIVFSASALSAACTSGYAGGNQAANQPQGQMMNNQDQMTNQEQGQGMVQPGTMRDRVQDRMQQSGMNAGDVRDRVQQSSWFNKNSNDANTNEPANYNENENNNRGFFSSMTSKDPQTEARDQQLISRVRQVLQNNNMNVRAIQVTSDDGTVTLRGVVLSPNDKENAESAVKSIQGVKSVSNKLSVQNQQ
jgi:osmotically-inducible protein OsmY